MARGRSPSCSRSAKNPTGVRLCSSAIVTSVVIGAYRMPSNSEAAAAIAFEAGIKTNLSPDVFYNKLVEANDPKFGAYKNKSAYEAGKPFLDKEYVVEATVLRHLSGPKVRVYKMRPKKKTRKTFGSRRKLTRVLIKSICKK